MGKNEDVEALYKDAITSHYVREGLNDFLAENIARRKMKRDDVL